jgi:hypothetical protein
MRRRVLVGVAALAVASVGAVTAVVLLRPGESPAVTSPPSIDGPRFSVQTPTGWSAATDDVRTRAGATPDMVVLTQDRPVPGKPRPVIAIGTIDLDAGEMADLVGAASAYCANVGAESAVTMAADVTSAVPAKLGAFSGCEVLAIGKTGLSLIAHAGRWQGRGGFVCSRDKSRIGRSTTRAARSRTRWSRSDARAVVRCTVRRALVVLIGARGVRGGKGQRATSRFGVLSGR